MLTADFSSVDISSYNLNMEANNPNSRYFGGGGLAASNGLVVLIPDSSDCVGTFDPVTNTFSPVCGPSPNSGSMTPTTPGPC